MSKERRSLAEQLAGAVVTDRRGNIEGVRREDGSVQRSGGFIALVEEAVPGIKAPIQRKLERVDDHLRPLGKRTVDKALESTPFVAPASPDDAIAREAAARVDERLWGAGSAAFRRHGCYDGDPEHQIALEALRLSREDGR